MAISNGICGAKPDPANVGLYKCKMPDVWETSFENKNNYGTYGTISMAIAGQPLRPFGYTKLTPDPTVPNRWTADLVFPHNTATVLLFGVMGIEECNAPFEDTNGTYAKLYDTAMFGNKPNGWYPMGSGGKRPEEGYAKGSDGKPDFSKPYFTSCPMKGGDKVGSITFDGLTWD